MAIHSKSFALSPGSLVAVAASVLLLYGCAATQARSSLEHVAKDWCETVRASQLLCVYPLTEDLRPGDVFLVQTLIADQVSLYRQRGFLALDDHIGRLDVSYSGMYFDGYWKDEFGQTPHARPSRPDSASSEPGQPPSIGRTEIRAPRVAFPTYRFEATSSGGLSLAIPIQGVPVGLGYLAADKVVGNVTIADARTYATDAQSLYARLKTWSEQPDVHRMLGDALRQLDKPKDAPPVLYLRTVSRVYLTGGVVVSLNKDVTRGAQAQVGAAAQPAAPGLAASAVETEQKTLTALNAQAKQLSAQLPGTGAINFASASASAVTLAESFDRPLVIGYLGFDVPVYEGGVLGAPIPTFERLEGRQLVPPHGIGLSIDQSRYKVSEHAFEALREKDPVSALRVARLTAEALGASEFATVLDKIKAAEKAMSDNRAEGEQMTKQALDQFKHTAISYVSASGAIGPNYGRFSDAFAVSYDHRDAAN